MADQDFNIKVVTTADTTGLRQTREEIQKVREAAEKARQDAGAAALFARVPPGGTPPSVGGGASGGAAGLTGTAVGIGTIVSLLTVAINKWKQFNDELDKQAENMRKATEKSYELGLSVVDMLDKASDIERINTEPLEQSFDRLTGDVRRLKTEMQVAFETGAYEDVKKLNGELNFTKGLLDRVNAGLERQAATAERTRQKQVQAQEDAYGSASPQAKAILANEKAAREAEARGDEISRDRLQKTADRFRASASPADLAQVQAVSDAYGKAAPVLSDVEKNKKAFDESIGKQDFTGGATGPSLIGDEARKAREAAKGTPTASESEEAQFQERQKKIRADNESKKAKEEREDNIKTQLREQLKGDGTNKTSDSKLSNSIDALVRELSKWS